MAITDVEQRAALVRRLYTALTDSDPRAAAAALTADAVLHVPGEHPLSGSHQGLTEILGFLAATRARAGGGERLDVLDLMVGHSHVAVYIRAQAERDDEVLDNHTLHLLRMAGDRVAEVWFHNRDQQHVDQFWNGGNR